jgi:hypothetical protein
VATCFPKTPFLAQNCSKQKNCIFVEMRPVMKDQGIIKRKRKWDSSIADAFVTIPSGPEMPCPRSRRENPLFYCDKTPVSLGHHVPPSISVVSKFIRSDPRKYENRGPHPSNAPVCILCVFFCLAQAAPSWCLCRRVVDVLMCVVEMWYVGGSVLKQGQRCINDA